MGHRIVYFRLFITYAVNTLQKFNNLGRGGGQVVSVLALYSNDPSSNPADANVFSEKLCLKRTKINQNKC